MQRPFASILRLAYQDDHGSLFRIIEKIIRSTKQQYYCGFDGHEREEICGTIPGFIHLIVDL